MDYSKVQDYPNLYRLNDSKCIVNSDKSGYQEYMRKREDQMEEKQKIHQLQEDFATLKGDLDEIKGLLRSLLKMNPEEITLTNLSKSFEYAKVAKEIDDCGSVEQLKNIAKSFCKLYYKQQETMTMIGLADSEDK